MNDSLRIVVNKSNEKYDVWTLADAAEYLAQQRKKARKYRKEKKMIKRSCERGISAGGIFWRYL